MPDYIPDAKYKSDNMLEIPTLEKSMQAEFCDLPFRLFGEVARTKDMAGDGTLHFYTDDYRFKTVWQHPEKIVAINPMNIVEPNFSIYADMPVAMGLNAIYKKRYIARTMQTFGIKVFVDMNVNVKFFDMNMLGVPDGWRAYCTRGSIDTIANNQMQLDMARNRAGTDDVLFVVYGGGSDTRKWCKDNGLIYVTPQVAIRNVVHSKEKAMEKMGCEVYDIREVTADLKRELTEKQIENFKNNGTESEQ